MSTSAPYRVPGELRQVLETLRGLEARVDDAATGTDRAGLLAGLREVVDAAEVLFTRTLATFDALGDAPVMSGQRDSVAWLHHELRLSAADARSRVQVARGNQLLAGPLAAACTGEVRFEHVRAIAAAVRSLQYEPDQQQAAVPVLHDLARSADPATVRRAGRRIREIVDPDGALRDQDRQFERRHLTLSPLLDGMTAIEGTLDGEGAATLSAALGPLMVPAGTGDTRSTGQRRADALVDIAALALRSEQLPELSGAVAAIDVVVPLPVPAAGAGQTPCATTACRPRDEMHPAITAGVVHDAPGGPLPLSAEAVQRLMCDAALGRVLLGPDSAVLDLGRRVRLFTHDQRRALNVRDAGCRFPGCTRPPRYTDAHHVVPWQRGGPTDIDNALLLCRWHHNRTHRPPERGGWRIRPDNPALGSNGGLVFEGPAGQQIESHPRAGP